MKYLLGVDIGSYSARGALLDETGQVLATAQRKHSLRVPAPGYAEHDALEDWWAGFLHVTRTLLEESGIDPARIAGIACSGIAPAVLPLDADNQPLRPAILYGIDARAEREIRELQEQWGIEATLQRCGNPITTQSIAPKIKWLARHEPELFARTRKVVGCATYLVHRLTGRFVVDHYCAASSTVYDVHQLNWASDLIASVCPPEWMPELAWTSDIAGHVTPEAARLTGLAAGTPVMTGTADAASEALSVGVLGSGDLMIMYGTTVFFIQVTPELKVDPRHWSVPYLFPGTACVSGGLATSGALTHWFREAVLGLADEAGAFTALEHEASQSPPGAHELLTLPYFSGERTPVNDPLAKGLLFGLNLTHTRGDIYRSLLEGIGHAIAHNLQVFAEASPLKKAYAVGGGVHNPTWLQATSDIGNFSQLIRQNTLGAALGDAILAGMGVGIFTANDVERINPLDHQVHARPQYSGLYQRHHRLYHALYRQTRTLMATMDDSPDAAPSSLSTDQPPR